MTSVARNDLIALDLVTMQWRSMTQFGTVPPPLWGTSFALLDNLAILFGGGTDTDTHQSNATYALNCDTRVWSLVSTVGQTPPARNGHSAVFWGKKMIIHGGVAYAAHFGDVFVLDFGRSPPVWSQPSVTGDTFVYRVYHTAMIVGNEMLVYGGGPNLPAADLWSLDLVRWAWSPVVVASSELPTGRYQHAAVVMGRQVWACLLSLLLFMYSFCFSGS